LDYLDSRGVRYRTDSSNDDHRYLRNRVRHELLPSLESGYNPQIRDALGRLADIQRDENEFLEELAESFLSRCLTPEGYMTRAAFAEGHPALQRRALALLGWRHGVDCPFDIIESARRAILHARAGYEIPLGAGLRLCVTRNMAEFLRDEDPDITGDVVLQIPGETTAFEKRFSVRYRNAPLEDEPARYCTPHRQVFDADALGAHVVLRRCRAGDRFTPYGMSGTRKLKDYLSEMGMPVTERNAQLLLVADFGIAWVVGHAIAARAAITPSTRNLIEFEVNDASL
jgi:tRNA(Ile)-lysidine synthase